MIKAKHEVPLALIACLLGAFLGDACARPYDFAWRTTAATQAAGKLIDTRFAAAVERAAAGCKKNRPHEDLKLCVYASSEWQAFRHWRDSALPAINSALVTTVAALTIAENQKNYKLEWMSLLKVAICAVSKVALEWKQYLGGVTETISTITAGVTCQ